MNEDSQSSLVFSKIVDDLATVTINRPQRRNAFDDQMIDSFAEILNSVSSQNPRAVILTGTGDSCFSAGYDITCIDTNQSLKEPLPDIRFEKTILAIERCKVPVIAAMNGDAYGGGLDLALSCDFRIAREAIKVAMTPCRLGLVYSASGIARFICKVGSNTTRKLFLTGRGIEATEAMNLGIIDEIVSKESLLEHSQKLASDIALGAPKAVLGTRRTIQYVEQNQGLENSNNEELTGLRNSAFRSRELESRIRGFLKK
ncbi:MAG: enoyl-CoA hydratase/isomerase family protein [Deltaproteobacteria bacterium]|nr:enoyl-CoA hydratase/isomerase family protein [Deltaproteobacteria bacterium]